MMRGSAPGRPAEAASTDVVASHVHRDVRALTPALIALRRTLHEHPELAFEEVRTAATLAEHLRALGLDVREGIGGTGLLALLDGAAPGRTLLIRADMDALPMDETTGRPYASKVPGRSHGCGHDVHSAVVATVAAVLARHRDRLAGRVAFVFQPADEPMLGARRMIDEGLLERVRPDLSLGLHVLPMLEAGRAVVQRGPLWASRDELLLMARPPAPPGIDLTRTAAQITCALYDLVEREGRSAEPVTFRVRSLSAEQPGSPWLGATRGEPSPAVVEVNLALYDNALRARLLRRIEEVARGIVGASGGTLAVQADYALPALVNDDVVTAAVERAADRVIGQPSTGQGWRNPFSDDFGLFMAGAPGCLMLLGTANPAKGITEIWHRPGFDVDEDALPLGAEILSLAAIDLLR
jgi:amidohydrolase